MAEELSKEIGIPRHVIIEAYDSYWRLIKETISRYDLINISSESDIDNIQKSFNIKHIGKLQTNFKIIDSINKNIKNESIKYKESSTNA